MARLTSGIFVSALMRRVTAAGGYAAIARKGADAAGAVFIALRNRDGSIRLYSPAPQTGYQDDQVDDRQFQLAENVRDDEALSAFAASEVRFDPDFWIVELELNSELPDLFAIMKP